MMGKQYYYSACLLLLLMALSLIFAVSSAEEIDNVSLLPKRHVRITNDLGKGLVLKIHCKSKDDDLGVHNLSFQGTYSWKFKTNAFLKITLFYCYMSWGDNVKGSFDVYRATRDDLKCTDCKWSIRTDGAYWFDAETNRWNLMYRWPKP